MMNVQLRRLDALRFYGGDVRERCSNGYMGKKSQDAMYGDENAYRTLNALLFRDIKSEQERIWEEDHELNPDFIRRIEETIQIYEDIFSLMKERKGDFDHRIVGKRIDRASAIPYYEEGSTQSFFSCSRYDYDSAFAHKNGIVLLEIEIAQNVPFIDYNEVLSKQEYKNWDEGELLLPPFLRINTEEVPLTPAETRKVKDQNKKPPKGKYRIRAEEFPDYRNAFHESQETLWRQILDEKEYAAHLLEEMNKKNKKQNYERYICWKEKLQKYMKVQFSNIWYGGDEC